ncbi:unnamed protein product [Rhodiola kirilowii]
MAARSLISTLFASAVPSTLPHTPAAQIILLFPPSDPLRP